MTEWINWKYKPRKISSLFVFKGVSICISLSSNICLSIIVISKSPTELNLQHRSANNTQSDSKRVTFEMSFQIEAVFSDFLSFGLNVDYENCILRCAD
jgi:hypothetical protein